MSAANRAARDLAQGTGVTWAQETDRRLKQALGVSQADARTTTQLWEALMTQMGFVYGTTAQKVAEWQRVVGENHSITYAALSLIPFHK